MNIENKFESGPEEVDLSESFLSLPVEEFNVEIRKYRKVPKLKIEVNLSTLDDDDFIFAARRLKAFKDEAGMNQDRVVVVLGRPEQKKLEINAFMSGVSFEVID